jgi:hypothetical protein
LVSFGIAFEAGFFFFLEFFAASASSVASVDVVEPFDFLK